MRALLSVSLVALACVGCERQAPKPAPAITGPYEFHVVGQGVLVWRVNRHTGSAEWATLQDCYWHSVAKESLDPLDLQPIRPASNYTKP